MVISAMPTEDEQKWAEVFKIVETIPYDPKQPSIPAGLAYLLVGTSILAQDSRVTWEHFLEWCGVCWKQERRVDKRTQRNRAKSAYRVAWTAAKRRAARATQTVPVESKPARPAQMAPKTQPWS